MKHYFSFIIIFIVFLSTIFINNLKCQTPWDYNGLSHIYNTNSGNVGIGNGNPFTASEKLEILGNLKLSNRGGLKIEGSSYNLGNFSIGTTDYHGSILNLYTDAPNKLFVGGNSDYGRITFNNNGDLYSYLDVKSTSDGYFNFSNSSIDIPSLLRINNNGKIGIGTDSPRYTLDVNGTINAANILKNGQALGQWSVNGTNLFYNDGNIGIGTNNPQQKLEVNGSIKIINGTINNSSDASSFPLRFSAVGNDDWGIDFLSDNTNKTSTKLDKNAKTNSTLLLTGMGLRIRDDANNGFFIKDKVTNHYRMVINQGKIGIGTDSPGYTLDVNGTINASNIYQNGQPLATSQWQNNGSNIYYNNGNIGFNTNNPLEQLQLGDRFVFHNGGQKIIGYNFHYDGQNDTRILQDYASNLCLRNDGSILFRTAPQGSPGSTITWTNSLFIGNGGNIGINTISPDPSYALSVLGHIRATEIKVETGWSDFVFKPEYKLKSVDEIEKYIKENGHLEGIPTEQEVKENGVELGNITSKLLQKIEELTLYIIEQNKEINILKNALNNK